MNDDLPDLDKDLVERYATEFCRMLDDGEVRHYEGCIIALEILRVIALSAGFPYEDFVGMINTFAKDFKNDWPIG